MIQTETQINAVYEQLAHAQVNQEYRVLFQAVQALAGVCDGAITQDGQGYNAPDAHLGRYLANTPLDKWTAWELNAAYEALPKYKRQLAGFGIKFETLPAPPKAPFSRSKVSNIPTSQERKIAAEIKQAAKIASRKASWNIAKELIVLSQSYDKELIAGIKASIQGVRYNSLDYTWHVKPVPGNAEQILKFISENGYQFSDELKEFLENLAKEPIIIPKEFRVATINASKLMITLESDYNLELVVKLATFPDMKGVAGKPRIRTIKVSALNIEAIAQFLEENQYEYSPTDFAALIENLSLLLEKKEQNLAGSRAEDSSFEVANLGGQLRSFQRAGVEFAVKNKRVMIGDDMGTGKTVQALATLEATQAFPAIIICPASLKLNWEREAKKWLPHRSVSVINGKTDWTKDITVINYDIVKKHLAILQEINAKGIVMDESHYLKNYKAQRTEAVKTLAAKAEIRLCLTGTPVLNRPQELLSQLGVLGRLNDVGGFWTFAKRYCNAHQTRFGWDMSGAANLDELNEKMRESFFIRRTKDQVLKELPAKQRSEVTIPLSNRAAYNKAEKDVCGFLAEKAKSDKAFLASIAHLDKKEQSELKAIRGASASSRAEQAEQLVRIEALKQLSAQGKKEAIKDWVESFLETGEKLVLFAWHQDIVKEFATEFNAPYITGSVSQEARQKAVDSFQQDPDCKLIVLNMQAGGVGLTLTAASNVAFIELGWNPGTQDQAEDRTHRIGQTKSVNAWYFLGENTIDQDIYRLIQAKREIVEAATDGGIVSMETSIQKEIINNLLSKRA